MEASDAEFEDEIIPPKVWVHYLITLFYIIVWNKGIRWIRFQKY